MIDFAFVTNTSALFTDAPGMQGPLLAPRLVVLAFTEQTDTLFPHVLRFFLDQ